MITSLAAILDSVHFQWKYIFSEFWTFFHGSFSYFAIFLISTHWTYLQVYFFTIRIWWRHLRPSWISWIFSEVKFERIYTFFPYLHVLNVFERFQFCCLSLHNINSTCLRKKFPELNKETKASWLLLFFTHVPPCLLAIAEWLNFVCESLIWYDSHSLLSHFRRFRAADVFSSVTAVLADVVTQVPLPCCVKSWRR